MELDGGNKEQRRLETGDRSHGPKMGYSAIKEVVEAMYIDEIACLTKPYVIFMNFRIGTLKKIKSMSFLKSAQRYTSLKGTVEILLVFPTFSSALDKTQYRDVQNNLLSDILYFFHLFAYTLYRCLFP